MKAKGAFYVSTGTTYGRGYCGICGDTGSSLVPRLVRYWDADDGWRLGVLCSFCFEDAEKRPPRPTDYAWKGEKEGSDDCARIDVIVALSGDDADGAITDVEELL